MPELKSSFEVARDITRISTLSDSENVALRNRAEAAGEDTSILTETSANRLSAALSPKATASIADEYQELDARREELRQREESQWAVNNQFRVLVANREKLLRRVLCANDKIKSIKEQIRDGAVILAEHIGLAPGEAMVLDENIARELFVTTGALPLFEAALETLVDETVANAKEIKAFAAANSINPEFIPGDLK